jgi:chromate transporter
MSGWMTDQQFADAFAQMSPSSNVPIVTLIGYSVAGVAGALVPMPAMCAPPAVLAYGASRLLARSNWPAILQAALVPLSIGLKGASALILAPTSDRTWAAALVTIAAAPPALAARLDPFWLLLAGGCLGFAGII